MQCFLRIRVKLAHNTIWTSTFVSVTIKIPIYVWNPIRKFIEHGKKFCEDGVTVFVTCATKNERKL